jgi:hypothetical protein
MSDAAVDYKPTPLCLCGNAAQKVMVVKENSSYKDTYVWLCAHPLDAWEQCKFFLPDRDINNPRCKCGTICKTVSSKKDNENNGRKFTACNGNRCHFFMWAEPPLQNVPPPLELAPPRVQELSGVDGFNRLLADAC